MISNNACSRFGVSQFWLKFELEEERVVLVVHLLFEFAFRFGLRHMKCLVLSDTEVGSSGLSHLSDLEIRRTNKDAAPAHYILKIKSFSQFLEILSKAGHDKYESDNFEAAGYNGNRLCIQMVMKMEMGDVASSDQKAKSNGCHVNALVNLFVYDHICDKYLTIQ